MLISLLAILYFLICFLICLLFCFTYKRFVKEYKKENIPMYFYMIFYFVNSLISNYVLGIKSIWSGIMNCSFLIISFYISKKLQIHGITGQISSGKSTVSKYLREKYNSTVIDIDKLNAEVLEEVQVKKEIKEAFGTSVFDELGMLNKKELRRIIFSDKTKKYKLEKITHFRVLKKLLLLILQEKCANWKKLILIENAILLKIPLLKYACHYIIAVVTHNKEKVIKRIMERDNMQDLSLAENILENQYSVEEFTSHADYVIINDESIEDLHKKVDIFIEAIKD